MKRSRSKPEKQPGDGIFLHASSVNINGKALVFLGHSSSGKSTIAQLLSEVFPVISDDKIYIYKKREKWELKSGDEINKFSEFQGKLRISTDTLPILSFMRIFKAHENKIEEIESLVLCRYLTDAVFEVDNQRRVPDIKRRKEWFKVVADIARKFEGRHFFFKKESNIIQILKKEFEY